jgi:hypothetical protein
MSFDIREPDHLAIAPVVRIDEADHVHFRRCKIARPITQSLSLSERKVSCSVKWVMRWR